MLALTPTGAQISSDKEITRKLRIVFLLVIEMIEDKMREEASGQDYSH